MSLHLQSPVHYSNVMLADPVTGGPVRATWRYLENGSKVRTSGFFSASTSDSFHNNRLIGGMLSRLLSWRRSACNYAHAMRAGENNKGEICIWVNRTPARDPEAAQNTLSIAR